MADLFILFESASGYSLFQKMELEAIGAEEDTVQAAMADKKSFSKVHNSFFIKKVDIDNQKW